MTRTTEGLVLLLLLSLSAWSISCGPRAGDEEKRPVRVVASAADGSTVSDLLDRIETRVAELEKKTRQQERKGRLEVNRKYDFLIEGAPSKGPEDATLVMVEFSDFECPFCRRFSKTADELVKRFPQDLRLVFMNFPLHQDCNDAMNRPFHKNACIAAEAAMAAHDEEKFWEMHDRIFQNQRSLSVEKLVSLGEDIGLDPDSVKEAVENKKYEEAIRAQAKQLVQTGSRGTPTVFINGMKVLGVRWDDVDSSARFIEGLLHPEEEKEEAALMPAVGDPSSLPRAEVLLDDGTRLEDRLHKILESLERISMQSRGLRPAPQRPKGPDPGKVYSFDVADSPKLGPDDAPVKVVTFSDFTCPHCERLAHGISELREKYGDKVQIIWMNTPNQRHRYSHEAHQAAMFAHEHGKFWEMHDKIFENRRSLSPEKIEELVSELGLDIQEYKAAVKEQKYRSELIEDLRQAGKADLTSTPTVFINGKYQMSTSKAALDRAIGQALGEEN